MGQVVGTGKKLSGELGDSMAVHVVGELKGGGFEEAGPKLLRRAIDAGARSNAHIASFLPYTSSSLPQVR